MHKFILLFLSLFITQSLMAFDCQDKRIEGLAVQDRGRVKPYLVMAEESVKLITGKAKYQGMKAPEVFCLWTKASLGVEPEFKTFVRVDHIDVKKFLDMNEDEVAMDFETLQTKRDLLRSEIGTLQKSTSYKKELEKVLTRLMTLESIRGGFSWSTPKVIEGEVVWHRVQDLFKTEEGTLEGLLANEEAYRTVNGTAHDVELTFTKAHIFSYSMLISIIAIMIVVLMRELTVGRWIAIASLLLQVVGMTMRVYISERAPITNMYETVMFSGFGALLLAVVITYFKREKLFLIGGLSYNILCLFMMMFANNMLDSSINPLVPVLRDNFWLSTHVTTIILSYAALALSWMIANIVLFKVRFKTISMKDYRYYESLIYTCIKVGIVTLAAGIILGGIWADYSWGRFWGWDPKETWSLIVLLFYMTMLHGKSTSWIGTHRFIVLSAAGFMTVMMAWFGVNYILATGLHSYGFSEGGAMFLGTFFLIQTVFLFITGIKPRVQNIKKGEA